MSRHDGRKRRKQDARRRAGPVEKRSTNSTPGEIPGHPSHVEKVADFVNTTQPTEGDETIADGDTIDAESLLGDAADDVGGDSVGDLRELLDHLRASPAKVSNGESAKKVEMGDMPKIGRPVVFNEIAKAKVLGLISAGVNQSTAAAFVGVARSTITKALRRDPQFAREVAQAQAAAKVHPLTRIIKQSDRSFTAARYLYEKVQPCTDLTDEEEDGQMAASQAQGNATVRELPDHEAIDNPPKSETNGSSPPADVPTDV